MKVKTYNGLCCWQGRLRDNYANFQEWENYAEMFALHLRLGCNTPQEAWDKNPTIQLSRQPTDFCKIVNGRRQFYNLDAERIGEPMDYNSLFLGINSLAAVK